MDRTVIRCRVCEGADFVPVLDLGMTPLADAFLTADQLLAPETYYPLKVVMCARCSLMQLTYVVDREMLYQMDYPYVSSTTDMGVQHYHDMAEEIVERFNIPHESVALDIGSNVGVLAEAFKELGMSALGIEPAPKIARAANMRGTETINEFFSADLAKQIVQQRGQAAVVTATNVVAHIDDLQDLFLGIRILLMPKGVFVFEAPYLGDLFKYCEYDTIYHEHLSYLAVQPIQRLCKALNLEVIRVEWQRIHGGTLRYYIALRGRYVPDSSVAQIANAENEFCTDAVLSSFRNRVATQKRQLLDMLYGLRNGGKTLCAVSAPAKGMTLLNYCKIDGEVIDYVTEKAPLKIGKYTPGGHLPVMPDESLLTQQPDYALLLAWNFADEIIANQRRLGYQGKFIIPIPEPRVVE